MLKNVCFFFYILLFFSRNLLDQGEIHMFSRCLDNAFTSSSAATLYAYYGWEKDPFLFVQNALVVQEGLHIAKASLPSYKFSD